MALKAESVRSGLLATAAAGALLLAGAGTAQADTHEEKGAFPGNWMMVGTMQGDDAFGPIDLESLHCPPLRGSGHPRAREACRDLRAAGGDINRIKPRDMICTKIYQPVTAAAYGMWNGRRTVYAKTFGNSCEMYAATGSVFKITKMAK
ncbi:SSI family serine proteinase inhibitor [Streptomyces sp. NBC_01304]|uniref:SSI family serine proteinase inhibitor n=1 Tax=Streptomyces sp. NBC_01304 TaxID=2903818 RepID=UPI002E0F293E|nr:subtilase-type protease inhibitor [Streptomyces sp. NBC_01304]